MSASVYVEAHREVSEDDLEYLEAYNALVAIGIEPPNRIIEYLQKVLGNDSRLPDEEIDMPSGKMISVPIRGEGSIEYCDGMIIVIADLPPGTVALRVYMMS